MGLLSDGMVESTGVGVVVTELRSKVVVKSPHFKTDYRQ